MLSRIHCVSKPAALPTKPSRRNSTTHTAPTLRRNGTRAEASWTRSQVSLTAAPTSGSLLGRGEVLAVVPLLRQGRQRAVGVHLADDLVDRLVQRLRRRV